ncbi:hypothetical protein KFL_015040010 [Klebsormidium nitens]|uniref:Uncharacterized protein n=1 Tax=Klebsormidium nitens TaxID=105231 RepID=A0A1Y1IWW8_KLENI|nr:hypothetical protein KFL_015040010 [Klebsormidium nitens]|eukprot:GAQ93406.1 hypothetical protein KFL_015040010 [Klebsormidium nitens]
MTSEEVHPVEKETEEHGTTEAVGAATEAVVARAEIALKETEQFVSPDTDGKRYSDRAQAAPGNFWETPTERGWIMPRSKKRAEVVEKQELSPMVLIRTDVLEELGVMGHTGADGQYVAKTGNDLSVVVRDAPHGAKVEVRTSGGRVVEDGGTLLFLEKGAKLEKEVEALLSDYACLDLDKQKNSLQKVYQRAAVLVSTPYNRDPETSGGQRR